MTNASLQSMRQLKLSGMADAYEAILALPIHQQTDPHQLIATLIDSEQNYRINKRLKFYIRQSKLRYSATLSDINCSPERNLNQQTIHQLADCAYIQRAENILITGATGCGKSYLACALGHQACLQGYRTRYFNLNRFLEQVALAKIDGTLIKWLNNLQKTPLLILDDFGIQPIKYNIQVILLQILEDRYDRASTIICSQLPVKEWHPYFKQVTLADAILDRLIPRAHRINLKGKSLRTAVNPLT